MSTNSRAGWRGEPVKNNILLLVVSHQPLWCAGCLTVLSSQGGYIILLAVISHNFKMCQTWGWPAHSWVQSDGYKLCGKNRNCFSLTWLLFFSILCNCDFPNLKLWCKIILWKIWLHILPTAQTAEVTEAPLNLLTYIVPTTFRYKFLVKKVHKWHE